MEAFCPATCPYQSAPPRQTRNCGNREHCCCCPMAPLESTSSSMMSPALCAPASCCSFPAPSFHCHCHQHHERPAPDACCPQLHARSSPPCFAGEAACPAAATPHCGAGHFPQVSHQQWPSPSRSQVARQQWWPAPSPYAAGLPLYPKYDGKRKKRHRKRTRRASPAGRRLAHQNDDSIFGDASADYGHLKPRRKTMRVAKGPTPYEPYAHFESTELSEELEREGSSAPKNCSLLPLVLVAIVAVIVLIGTAGYVGRSIYAEFPPGGDIIYKSATGRRVDPFRPRYAARPDECSVESCQWQSRYIAQKLNHSVSPCVDFYSYVCSKNWFRSPYVSSQPYAYSAPTSTMLKVWNFLKGDQAQGSNSFVSEAALFMRNCVNGPKRDTAWNVLRKILETLGIGGWPYGGAPPHSEAHTVASKAEKMLGVASLVSVSMRERPSSHQIMLHVNSPPVLLRRHKIAFPGSYIKSYGEFIFKVLSLSNPGGRDVQPSVLGILMLEERISGAAAQSVRNVPVLDVTLPIANMTSHPHWNWQAYFQHFIKENKGLPSRDKIALMDPAYFNQLPNIVSRFTVQTMLNYVGYKLIVSISPLLPPDKAEFMVPLSYHQHVSGGVPKRLKACFSLLERLYPRATSALVWSKVLKRAPTLLSGDIMDDIRRMEDVARHEMKQAAAKAPWMSQKEAAVAVLKMERVKVVLLDTDSNGTLDQQHPLSPLFKNVSLIEAYYELQKVRRAEYWRTGSKDRLREPLVERDSAFRTGFIYEPDHNEVFVFPATIEFITTISRHLDVVSVPFLLGEVLRGMFSAVSILGSTIDADGRLRQWWTPTTKQRFIKRAKCFQSNFADEAVLYVKEGLREESLFLEDNVVDGAVLRPLYNIHVRLTKESSSRGDSIPGQPKDLNPNKLFFISWASTFCEPEQPEEALRERLRFKLSVPSRIRLNVALSRFPPFSAAFSCDEGSAMNPTNMCSFW